MTHTPYNFKATLQGNVPKGLPHPPETYVAHRFETSQNPPFSYKKFDCPSTINKSSHTLCNF